MRDPFAVKTPGKIADIIRSLPPELKRAVRAAIDAIAASPETGGRLDGELKKYWKYRVRRYRLIYAVDRSTRVIRIVALSHRRNVYEELAAQLRNSQE